MIVIVIKYSSIGFIVFGIKSINRLLCGVINFVLNSIESVFVIVLFIIYVGIICIGFLVVKGIVFLEIKYRFRIKEVFFVLCFFVLNLFFVIKVVKFIFNVGIIFVVMIVVIGV